MMKSLIILTASLMLLCSLDYHSSVNEVRFSTNNNKLHTEYQRGWADGHCEGLKDVKGQYAICPITPICPIPEIGQDNYRGGYDRGFKAATRAANRN